MISLALPTPSVISLLRRPAPPDSYRSLLDPLWTSDARGIVVAVTPLTPTASTVLIRTNRAWPGHRAGQYLTLGIEIDGVRHHRSYSITTPSTEPGRRLLEIGVQHVSGGRMSTHIVRDLAPGDLVHLGGPDGDFTLDGARLTDLAPDRILMISGGSGVTPIVAMLRELDRRAPSSDVCLLHHAPTADQTMFAAELRHLAERNPWLRVHLVETRGGGAHLDAARLDELCPDWTERHTFVCGPAPMIDFATDQWTRRGVVDRLHLERFTPVVAPRHDTTTTTTTAVASFHRSGTSVDTDSATTLLDAAESAGVLAPSGCRAGVCHTCSTRLVSGCTTDLRDGRVSEPGAHVQLCVSAALTDVVLDV